MPNLLVIDDDPDILLTYINHAVGDLFGQIHVARTGSEGLELAVRCKPSVVLLDVYLPDMNGMEVLLQLQNANARCPILVITGASRTDTAIEAMKRGAFEYLIKPPDLGELQQTLTRALDVSRQMNVPAVIAKEEPSEDGADVIIGQCRAMREVYKAIGQVAERDVPVLILGESGTGKELVARAVYQHSKRSQGPFLPINCAAIPEALLESELFGHEQGAFTGAVRRRIGKFEQCAGGTLFLDEIGDLSPDTQGKVLRILQEQKFERVGSNDTIQSNVRIVAATNRDLYEMVGEGLFRADLYYRLAVCEIHLPALRERGGDLEMLVRNLLRRFCKELDKPLHKVAPATMELLERYSWPGNVRELQNVLRQALLRSTGDMLVSTSLPEHIRTTALARQQDPPAATGETPAPGEFATLVNFIREQLNAGTTTLAADVETLIDRVLLAEVLAHTGGNQFKAAQRLGYSRRTLRNKLRALGLKIERFLKSGAEVDDDDEED